MVELLLQVPAPIVEQVSDALMECDALAVTVVDADADTPDEHPLFGEPGRPEATATVVPGWNRSLLKALFENVEQAEAAWEALEELREHDQGIERADLVEVEEQDWVRLTQSQFDPVEISGGFWIVPSWHDVPAGARQVIRLDPGLAFGTGTHPTTKMCLRWIARHMGKAGPGRVLDYGCGSGILAIAARMHGAGQVDAVDIDPAAVTSTRDNAQANGVTLHTGLPVQAQGEYDVVLANILAAPLKLLAGLLCAHVKPGGHIVLAGLLERQVEDLQAAYAPWLQLQVGDQEDGWVMLTGRKL